MIELIGTKGQENISKASEDVMLELGKMIAENAYCGGISVCEVGVGIGATAVEIVKRLREQDSYSMFGFESAVNSLYNDLSQINRNKVTIIPCGNSTRDWDSYVWSLGKILLDTKEKGLDGIYDLVYLDGAHDVFHDATACCILKLLTKVNGIIIFDDYYWSYAKSPTQNPEKRPEILKKFTMEQLETSQVKMVVDMFMVGDSNWVQIENENLNKSRVIYKRIK